MYNLSILKLICKFATANVTLAKKRKKEKKAPMACLPVTLGASLPNMTSFGLSKTLSLVHELAYHSYTKHTTHMYTI